MKPYELTYIISSEITSDQVLEESKNIESLIQNKKGIILKSEKPSPRILAYHIKKQGSGFLGVLEFQLEPEYLGELKEKLQKNGKIIRHMIIIKNPVKIQKERRTGKKSPISKNNQIMSEELQLVEPTKEKKINKKIELEEIEKELDEILNK